MDDKKDFPAPWGDDVPLRGDGVPQPTGRIRYLIEYLLTVLHRFGDTSVTFSVQWGASALWMHSKQSAKIEMMEKEIVDLKAALQEARGGTYPQPKKGWQCFFCGEWFTTPESARSHFGEPPKEHI